VWQHLLTLPLVVKVIALLGVLGAATYTWLKRKVISTAIGSLSAAARTRFWNYVRKNVTLPGTSPTLPNQRVYKGVFMGYFTYENYPHENFFDLVQDDATLKVPVRRTNFFSGVQHGAFVEVDTEVTPGVRDEIVRRVRVLK